MNAGKACTFYKNNHRVCEFWRRAGSLSSNISHLSGEFRAEANIAMVELERDDPEVRKRVASLRRLVAFTGMPFGFPAGNHCSPSPESPPAYTHFLPLRAIAEFETASAAEGCPFQIQDPHTPAAGPPPGTAADIQ